MSRRHLAVRFAAVVSILVLALAISAAVVLVALSLVGGEAATSI